ncbi:MAG: Hpt domain-containing protein [Pseudomonadota bacterium]|nr:Hpt domain-containing protein [Pseudomonadota bacterium]
MAVLRARFLDRCVGDLERMEGLIQRGALDSEEMQALAHSLAGAAGTFGFPDIGAAAGDCDDAFARGRAPDRATVERVAAEIRKTLATRTG